MAGRTLTEPYLGRVVAVTGGARGIGLATARALVRRGAAVAVGDLDGELAAAEAAALGGRAFGMALDVTDRSSFTAFLDEAERRFDRLDVLVNNAGIMPLGALTSEPDELTRRILDINVGGVLLGSKLAAGRMATRGGHIINIASGVGRIAQPRAVTYSASKYAVVGATEALRAELAADGIEVSCILPMVVNTQLGAGVPEIRGQRTLEPDEVAEAVLRCIRKPRFETWVPASGLLASKVMNALPRTWADALARGSGAGALLANTDMNARDDYELRARGGSDDNRPDQPAASA